MKLTDTVKSEQVDKEMADIKKYQAKIEELGQKVSNLSRDSTDEVGTEQSLHVAALLRGLAEKLAAQVFSCDNPSRFESCALSEACMERHIVRV